jgi:hypothetical protein
MFCVVYLFLSYFPLRFERQMAILFQVDEQEGLYWTNKNWNLICVTVFNLDSSPHQYQINQNLR